MGYGFQGQGQSNEQYRFTTWRLGAPLGALLALGILLKFTV
jgi:hypothetical protein